MSQSKETVETRIQRSNKSSNVLGTLAFVGLRGADPLLQYGILAHSYGQSIIKALGGKIQVQNVVSHTGYAFLDDLHLSPYRLGLLTMACGSSVKHIIWKVFIGEENMSPQFAGFVGVFNTFFNTANSLLFLNKLISPAANTGEGANSLPLIAGSTIFAAGILIELVAEIQRKAFKSDSSNRGKPYTGGLFGIARHPNYMGYTLWRTGYAIAAGGLVWGGLTFGFLFNDFATRAIPSLNEYCEQKYADIWHDYCSKTPYVLIPGLY